MLFNLKKSEDLTKKAELVFEISFEVCNKVGGIHTVLSTKASQMKEYYGQKYFLIGPYFPERAKAEFSQEKAPPELIPIFQFVEKQGVRPYYGNWLVNGEPRVILLDFEGLRSRANEIKAGLWDSFRIDSLSAGDDFTEPVVFSFAVFLFFDALEKNLPPKKIVAHFHEWLSGAGILLLKNNASKIRTVFTTHATVLGRSLAFRNIDFYSKATVISDTEKEAENFHVKAKHQLEKAASWRADIFSAVSEITAWEAEKILGRRPDIVLPNGLAKEKLFNFEELTVKHRLQKERLKEFIIAYFFPYYKFDIESTLFYFLASRYEVRAKGIDVFIHSLGILNRKLKKTKSEKTIVAFLLVPASNTGPLREIIENKEHFQDIRDSLENVAQETESKMLYILAQNKDFAKNNLFTEDFLLELRKKLLALKRRGLPPLSTHQLSNENDSILNFLQEEELLNKKEDRVKVIFYADYLNGHDGLSNLNYEEMIQACHLGVFPSAYEPWGYTPLEAGGFGVASLTTDLAGFGKFCLE
ncbi:glycogen/starch synthase, partial [Candidatus Gribaldobacteria bacterium]|nr:glycogen/starch synthase [Candidatus Gribaldobacteria bacterium]